MGDNSKDSLRSLRLRITLVATITLLLRYLFPQVVIDGITIGLIVLAFIPWLSPVSLPYM